MIHGRKCRMQMEDAEIIELYWKRSECAITETAGKYGRYCHSIIFRIVGDEEDTEECVNDTWLKAWNAMPPHRPEKLSAFLGRISRNLALDCCKGRAAQKRGKNQAEPLCRELEECLVSPDSVEGHVEEAFLIECINAFLKGLPASYRIIFVLRYWHVCSIREIADRFGMSQSKVTSILFRVRKALKKALEKEEIIL